MPTVLKRRDGTGIATAHTSKARLVCANKANLREANLREANLREADLREANLYGADLREANLYGADLRAADLYRADLYGANLREADLYGADLREADLREANLYGADLYEADLYGAHLRRADLYGANLREAHLYGADLREANLYGANLYGACIEQAKLPHFQIPQEGELIVWAKKGGILCKMRIPDGVARTASLVGRKCRAAAAELLWTETGVDRIAVSGRLACFYVLGSTTYPDKYDPDPRVECTHGIHFFLTREEAEEW